MFCFVCVTLCSVLNYMVRCGLLCVCVLSDGVFCIIVFCVVCVTWWSFLHYCILCCVCNSVECFPLYGEVWCVVCVTWCSVLCRNLSGELLSAPACSNITLFSEFCNWCFLELIQSTMWKLHLGIVSKLYPDCEHLSLQKYDSIVMSVC